MNYARVKCRVLEAMGDEEGVAVMEYIDELRNATTPDLIDMKELIKAVAHIGVDFGYGKFELTKEHIESARSLYESAIGMGSND